jgi:hypothetical protein
MANIRNDPAARLDRLIESVSTLPLRERLAKLIGPPPEPIGFGPDWEEDAIRAAAALRVESSSGTNLEAPIEIAFQKFGLDPRNPDDWRTLVVYFAFVHFALKTTPARGRKREWGYERLCQLLDDIAEKRRKHPRDHRKLMDFRRSGSQEAQAGGVDPLALATKMANSITQSKRLQDIYLPKRATTVRLADEARKRGRQKLRAERAANEKLKLTGRGS